MKDIIHSKKKPYAIEYPGQKTYHLDFIYNHIDYSCNHFVDVFCGSGVVGLGLVEKFNITTLNDIDSNVVNFFRVLRDENKSDILLRKIELTPFSREEFELSRKKTDDEIERARRWYINLMFSHSSAGNMFSISLTGVRSARATTRYLNKSSNLYVLVNKLKYCQIEHLDGIKLIQKYDNKDTFLYVDPPYIKESRNSKKLYKHEIDDEYHIRLAEVLNNCVSKVAVSLYECELSNQLYKNWNIIKDRKKKLANKFRKGYQSIRQEVLYTNYEPRNNLTLF